MMWNLKLKIAKNAENIIYITEVQFPVKSYQRLQKLLSI